MSLQGLPDAKNPESVLELVDSLQAQLLTAKESLGELQSQYADQTGQRSAEGLLLVLDTMHKQAIPLVCACLCIRNDTCDCLQATLRK